MKWYVAQVNGINGTRLSVKQTAELNKQDSDCDFVSGYYESETKAVIRRDELSSKLNIPAYNEDVDSFKWK